MGIYKKLNRIILFIFLIITVSNVYGQYWAYNVVDYVWIAEGPVFSRWENPTEYYKFEFNKTNKTVCIEIDSWEDEKRIQLNYKIMDECTINIFNLDCENPEYIFRKKREYWYILLPIYEDIELEFENVRLEKNG